MSKILKYKTKYILLKNEINQIIKRLKSYHKNINIIQNNINTRNNNKLCFIIITGIYAIGKTIYSDSLSKIYNYPVIDFNKIIYDLIHYCGDDIINQIFLKFNTYILKYQSPIIININIKYLYLLHNNFDLGNHIVFFLNPTNINLYHTFLTLKIKDDICNNLFNLSNNIYDIININNIIYKNKLFFEDEELIKILAYSLIENSNILINHDFTILDI